jgi:hypothetical protein
MKIKWFRFRLIWDRRSVGQSVLVSGSHLEPMTRFLFSVWQLRVSCYGAPSLTRGWFCNLLVQLLLGLARAITLESDSSRTQTIFYCLIWNSPSLEIFPNYNRLQNLTIIKESQMQIYVYLYAYLFIYVFIPSTCVIHGLVLIKIICT